MRRGKNMFCLSSKKIYNLEQKLYQTMEKCNNLERELFDLNLKLNNLECEIERLQGLRSDNDDGDIEWEDPYQECQPYEYDLL